MPTRPKPVRPGRRSLAMPPSRLARTVRRKKPEPEPAHTVDADGRIILSERIHLERKGPLSWLLVLDGYAAAVYRKGRGHAIRKAAAWDRRVRGEQPRDWASVAVVRARFVEVFDAVHDGTLAVADLDAARDRLYRWLRNVHHWTREQLDSLWETAAVYGSKWANVWGE